MVVDDKAGEAGHVDPGDGAAAQQRRKDRVQVMFFDVRNRPAPGEDGAIKGEGMVELHWSRLITREELINQE